MITNLCVNKLYYYPVNYYYPHKIFRSVNIVELQEILENQVFNIVRLCIAKEAYKLLRNQKILLYKKKLTYWKKDLKRRLTR